MITVGVVATIGLVTVTGVLGLVLAGGLLLTAPPCVGAAADGYRRRFPPPRAPDGPARTPADPQPSTAITQPARTPSPTVTDRPGPAFWDLMVVTAMPDGQLCRAWQASYLALESYPPADHYAIAVFRAVVLDELHRRHPDAVSRWMDDGARAASSPGALPRRHRSPVRSRPSGPVTADAARSSVRIQHRIRTGEDFPGHRTLFPVTAEIAAGESGTNPVRLPRANQSLAATGRHSLIAPTSKFVVDNASPLSTTS